eukprot:TRINITY_DN5836_c1_g1_i10.p1 TRINITY_DN5836_c1_g1~~TRINITY_DN5836_c1_g1_i10.p1  ORF type:complete len:239 (-),score=-20.58 TRINITY_DN5836_c1_g1_i10:35-751(-)
MYSSVFNKSHIFSYFQAQNALISRHSFSVLNFAPKDYVRCIGQSGTISQSAFLYFGFLIQISSTQQLQYQIMLNVKHQQQLTQLFKNVECVTFIYVVALKYLSCQHYFYLQKMWWLLKYLSCQHYFYMQIMCWLMLLTISQIFFIFFIMTYAYYFLLFIQGLLLLNYFLMINWRIVDFLQDNLQIEIFLLYLLTLVIVWFQKVFIQTEAMLQQWVLLQKKQCQMNTLDVAITVMQQCT